MAVFAVASAGRASPSGAAARHSIQCAPSSLGVSARPPGSSIAVSPQPGTRAASASTQISVLGVPAAGIRSVSATGSRSGLHTGRLVPYSQGDGASWIPDRPFLAGERVVASVSVIGARTPAAWRFQIATPTVLVPVPSPPGPRLAPPTLQYFHSRPDLRPPSTAVTADAPRSAPGLLFLAPYSGPEQSGPMIFNDQGQLVWFDPLGGRTQAADFRVQLYHGAPALTWWQDPIDSHGHRHNQDVIVDSAYHVLATVQAGNGLDADHHEFELGPNDTALLAVYNAIRCDLSGVGGHRDDAVWDGVVQEIDIPTGLVRFEWHSLDHVALSESYASAHPSTAGQPFDFFHLNSINVNHDGTLMISARHTWTVYDLDPRTGQLRWRLGGRRSSFTMGPGTKTAWQHDARELPDGSITIFDNGAVPAVHPQSRGIVVRLDLAHRRAVLVRRIEHPHPLLSGSQGDVQALPNGDWLVGWGQLPWVSEFSPSGRLLFDAHLPPIEQSYRAFRFPWVGHPSDPPAIAVVKAKTSQLDVYASWNGATQVAGWEVLEGPSPTDLHQVTNGPQTGFETELTAAADGAYVAVVALDARGSTLGISAAVPA